MIVQIEYMPRPISNPNLTKWETQNDVLDAWEVAEGFARYLRIRFRDPQKGDYCYNMKNVKSWEKKL